jgi:polyisoprenyl-teichoic acid--peptidoglycan teichoic acid transferase
MVAGIVTLLLIAGLVGYAVFTYVSLESKLAPESAERDLIEEALDQPAAQDADSDEPEHTYILLLGSDRRPGQTRARSDTIILARLSESDRSVVLVSIPRDTRTEVPGHGVTKINHASAYGGVPLAIETVKNFTGLPVNHYVEIDFAGFGSVVDMLGGIDMYVDRPVDYGQGIVVDTGMQHLNGKQALAVVRNRKAYADGDFARVRNQRAFLSAVARKASSPGNLDKLPRILSESADSVTTDLSVAEITGLMRAYRQALQDDLPGYTVPGAPAMIGGVSYVVTDEEAASALFEALARGETPTP